MARDRSFLDFVLSDVLGDFSGIREKPLFSGWGIYRDGVIFALVMHGELYFKVSPQDHALYEAIGSHPLTFSKKDGKEIALPYWLVPEEVWEDRPRLQELMDHTCAE